MSAVVTGAAVATSPAEALAPPKVPVGAVDSVPIDPVVNLYRDYRVGEAEAEHVHRVAYDARAELVRRWGEIPPGSGGVAFWGHDPLERVLTRLNDESDRLNEAATDILDVMMATPVSSLAGVLAKLRAAGDVLATIRDPAYHEDLALTFLREAVRYLDGASS